MTKVVQMTDIDGVLRAIVANAITGVSLEGDTVTIQYGIRACEFVSPTPEALFDHIVNEVKHPDSR